MPARNFRIHYLLLFLTLLLFTFNGCNVKYISSYDETTDKSVTALQRKVESLFITLESQDGLPECAYDNHTKFYQDAKVELSSIKVRAAAIPKNEITAKQIELLYNSLSDLEKLHKIKKKKTKESGELKCISADEIKPLRTAFNSSFTAILKLELAKKRGEK